MNQRHQQMLTKLPTKQKTFDFGVPKIWQQVPSTQRRECIAAIAELVLQVAAVEINNKVSMKRNDEHE